MQKKKKRWPKILGITLLVIVDVLAVAALGGYLYLRKRFGIGTAEVHLTADGNTVVSVTGGDLTGGTEDGVYLHHPAGDYMGAWHDLEDAYKAGKVRAIGISNFDNYMDAFNQIMEEAEIRPQITQIECHPFAQRQETRALAAQYDIVDRSFVSISMTSFPF